ncbi:hypothetical protein MRB53_019387 [Persea americana]|uniref:Uncharacterized protein n=1 Tax=Persea americana TaxID=3435 RepID=A0ACC2KYD7_PERAE|nr:hypothetical protein MRB53_019387 [Persea americana]
MPGGNRLVNSAGGDCLRYGYCQPAADAAGLTCGEQRCRAWDKLSQQQPTSSLYFGFDSCNRQHSFKATAGEMLLHILDRSDIPRLVDKQSNVPVIESGNGESKMEAKVSAFATFVARLVHVDAIE